MSRNLKIRKIKTFDEWEGIRDKWNQLLKKSFSDNIFLTWEWLYSWAECNLNSNRYLYILSVEEGDNLVGIAPLYIEKRQTGIFRVRKIFFLGYPECCADYLDVIIKRGYEKEVTAVIYEFLNDEKGWDIIELHNIPSNSFFLLHFFERINQDGKYASIRPDGFCPIIILPESVEDFYMSLSSNRRQQFRRHLNILKREGEVKHFTFLSGQHKDLKTQLIYLCDLYRKSRNMSTNFSMFLERLILRSQEQGSSIFQLDFLAFNNKYIAGLLHFRYNGSLYMYVMAVDKSFKPQISIGNIIVGLSIERAILDKIKIYDFLRGTEDYKFHWSNKVITLLSIQLYKKNFLPLFYSSRQFCKDFAKIILR